MSTPFSTEIIQLPAIMANGVVTVLSHEMKKLDSKQLRSIAAVMGGKVVFVKVRASYEVEEKTPLCNHYNCYRPVKELNTECGDH
jgi:hypothetical protein